MAAVIQLQEGAAPATPGSGYHDLYFTTDGKLHILTDGAVDTVVADTAIQLVTANIVDANVVNAKLSSMAEATIKGRAAAAGTGVPVDLTAAQVATIMAAYLPGVTDAAWVDMTLTSLWATTATIEPDALAGYTPTYGVPAYRKVAGVVHLQGALRCTSNSASAVFSTLPVGYRPVADMFFPRYYSTSSIVVSDSWLVVKTNGEMLLTNVNGNSYHLDGIAFVPA